MTHPRPSPLIEAAALSAACVLCGVAFAYAVTRHVLDRLRGR